MTNDYQNGEIVNVDFGLPKEVTGYVQEMERPCLIIKVLYELQLAIIIPCTAKIPKHNYYSILKLTKGTANLKKNSFLLCHQIRTISLDRIVEKIGTLGEEDFRKVKGVLLDVLEM